MLRFFLETLLLVCLPIISMSLFPAVYTLRHLVGILIGTYIIARRRYFHFPPLKSVLTCPSRSISILTIVISIIISFLLFILYQTSPQLIHGMVQLVLNNPQLKIVSLISYPLFSVPLQELLFRWFYLFHSQSSLKHKTTVIILNAFLFSLVHLPFNSPLMLLGTFVLGLWWNHLTLKYHSIIPSTVSHIIIGTTLLALGI